MFENYTYGYVFNRQYVSEFYEEVMSNGAVPVCITSNEGVCESFQALMPPTFRKIKYVVIIDMSNAANGIN